MPGSSTSWQVYNILGNHHVVVSINCRIEERSFSMDEPGSELGASVPQSSHAHDLPYAQTTNDDGKKPKNVPFQPIAENLQAVDENTEGSLVEQAEEGSGEAFRILQERHEKEICRFIARMIGDYEVALELTQETFIKAWQSLPVRDHKRPMNFRA